MFFTVITICLATMGGIQDLGIETIKAELAAMEYEVEQLPTKFQLDFQVLQDQIDQYEENPDQPKLEDVRLMFAKLQYGYELLRTLEQEERKARQNYFNLWHKASQLKKRVDNLYVSKEKGGSQALMIESEISKVRKKPIYEAYTAIYTAYGRKLKNVGECDHRAKTELVKRMIPVLENAEKLLEVTKTRTFEKELKKTSDVNVLEDMLVNYPF